MAGWLFPADAVSSAPNYTARAAAGSLSALVAGGTAARPLGAFSGVRPLATQPISIAGLVVTVGPHAGVLDLETSNLSGARFYSFDTNQTVTINALPSSPNTRIDYISVQENDHTEDGSTTAAPVVVYTAGTAANPGVAPTLPARNLLIGVVNASSTTATVSWVAPNAVAAGGIIPVANSALEAALTPSEGQGSYRQDINALRMYNGASWDTVAARMGDQLQTIQYVPPSTLNTPSSGTAAWVAFGNVTVPLWATQAVVDFNVVSMTTPSTALNVNMQAKIGTGTGLLFRIPGSATNTGTFCFGYTDVITSLTAGSQLLQVVGTFVAGTGNFQLTTGSVLTAKVTFLP